MKRRAVGLLALGLTACVASGCAGWGLAFGGDSSLDLQSATGPGELAPGIISAVFASNDQNTADVYLSDLPLSVIGAPDTLALDAVRGVIVHMHLFLTPYAGRTPIDFNASNTAIRVFVLAPAPVTGEPPVLGVYGGGGFLLPADEPTGDEFTARVKRATVRLTDATPDFADRLGVATLSGHVRAVRDDATARAIGANLAVLIEEREAAPAQPIPPQGE